MLVDVTITHLEMTAPHELLPGRPPPAGLAVEFTGADVESAELFRETYVQVGTPHHWISRTRWTEQQWSELLARPDVHA